MGLCKDGYWRESERYDGREYTATGKSQRKALTKLAAKISEAKEGMTAVNENMTVRQWAVIWLDTYKKHSNLTDKSYAMYEQKLNKFVLPAIGRKKMKDIKESHLQRILNDQQGGSRSSVSKLRMVMQQMFHKAVRTHIINYDPAEDLELPLVVEGARRSLTKEERSAILKTAETHYAGLWVKLILYCGLRPGETIALQWKDIDLVNKRITISMALESGSTDTFKAPKTEAGNRVVPIPDHLITAFESQKGDPFAWVFTQVLDKNKGKHHTESSLHSYWNNFKRHLDIDMGAEVYRNQIIESKVAKDLTPYVLRHTFCTDLQTAGVPLNIAKELMGHEDITVTANIYTHFSEEDFKSAADKINKYHSRAASD
ncbi:MAG: site-specific integrase [Clostridia bacterium]|nr:site-specific integrase [Clostridia bacterium]